MSTAHPRAARASAAVAVNSTGLGSSAAFLCVGDWDFNLFVDLEVTGTSGMVRRVRCATHTPSAHTRGPTGSYSHCELARRSTALPATT